VAVASPSPDPVVALDGVDDWADGALDELTRLPGVDRVGVAVVEGGGRRLLYTANDRVRGDTHEWCHLDAFATAPLNHALATGDVVADSLDTFAGTDGRWSDFVAAQDDTPYVAVAVVPFADVRPAVGGFVLYYSVPQGFEDGQHDELRSTAGRLEDALRAVLEPAGGPAVAHSRPAPGTLVADHEMPADPSGVGGARRFLRQTLAEWSVPPDLTDRAVLCLSELATNALIHTGGGCHVRIELHDGVLTARVHDNGATVEPRVRAADDSLHGNGHGLRLVDAMVDSWGRTTDAHSAAVWFELAVS
jgi:anti-sigma regulatory factor (Ser/Thr protein kinase)